MKTQPRPSDRELLAGLVERVAYQNAENGFCVIRFRQRRTARFLLGTLVNVCHNGRVTVRINDRGPFARGCDIDLSPAAARAINLHQTGHVQMSR